MSSASLYLKTAQKIMSLIDSGVYETGCRLPTIRDLATKFDVSPAIIREAQIALEAQGAIVVKHRLGAYVLNKPRLTIRGLAKMDLFELIEARALVAVESAGIAAPIITSQVIGELEQIEALLFGQVDTDLSPTEIGASFYNAIAQATRNQVIILITESLWNIRTDLSKVEVICRRYHLDVARDYAYILEAFRNKDASAARKGMQSHFKRLMDELLLASEQEAYHKMKSQVSENRSRFLLSVNLG